jgi:hypothetical protein
MPGASRVRRDHEELRQRSPDITNVLRSLHGVPMPKEYLSLWGQLNRWVSEWAEADRAREEEKQRRRTRGMCSACQGYGNTRRYGDYFVKCSICGGSGRSGVYY